MRRPPIPIFDPTETLCSASTRHGLSLGGTVAGGVHIVGQGCARETAPGQFGVGEGRQPLIALSRRAGGY